MKKARPGSPKFVKALAWIAEQFIATGQETKNTVAHLADKLDKKTDPVGNYLKHHPSNGVVELSHEQSMFFAHMEHMRLSEMNPEQCQAYMDRLNHKEQHNGYQKALADLAKKNASPEECERALAPFKNGRS